MVHPIVEQMEPSTEQVPAITWRGGDLVVTAGAGSGKTRTLVARYLALLAEGLPLRSVVAVTFTRKAAREMRNRVRLQVQRYLEREHLADERQRWLEIYGALDAARIGTIHSLCNEFLRAHPAEANVDPRFEVLDEGQTSLLRRQAVAEGLAWAATAPEARSLYDILDEGDLRAVAEQMLSKRLDVEPALESSACPWPAWQRELSSPLVDFIDNPEVQAAFGELAALRGSSMLARAQAACDELAPIVGRLCEAWDLLCAARMQGDWVVASGWFSSLNSLLKQKGKKANWAPANPKETIGALQELYRQVPSWLCKGDLALDRLLAEAMPSLSGLYASMTGAYNRLREERNALDFDDLEERAVLLLQKHDEVLARWRADVQAILVDEFQDTNRRQLKLMDLLNGGRGCAAYVGDDKQSIYRFRGADVSLFREVERRCAQQDAMGPASMKAVDLQVSYRAHRELLSGLNTLLRPALGEQADQDLKEHRPGPESGWAPPYIELHLTVGSKGEDRALERAAGALANRLRKLVSGARMVREGDRLRSLGYGDIAILCRASSSFGAYEDALDSAGIPFTTVAGQGFYQRPEVRDLLNALRALSEPSDDLALAGLLRSPALCLSDATLYLLCRQKDQGNACLWDVLQGTLPGIEDVEKERVRHAATLIGDLHEQVGRNSVADLLKRFLDDTQYRAGLEQAGQGRAVRNVDKLLADAHASGVVSVGEFLEVVSLLRDAGTREGEARAMSEGAVQIMSVHAAKGLEFPVVVLGDISAEKGSPSRILVDPLRGILLPLQRKDQASTETHVSPSRGKHPAIYLLAQEREEQQEREESARLLYVAATRAREMLIISGCIRLDGDKRPTGLGEWLGWLAEPLGLHEQQIAHEKTGCRVAHLNLHAGHTPVSCDIYEPGCSWERAGASGPGMDVAPLGDHRLLAPLISHQRADRESGPMPKSGPRVWQVMPVGASASAPPWVVGQLVHEALSAWRFPGVGFDAWAEARARTLGLLDMRVLRDAVDRSTRLLWRFKGSALYEEMNNATQRFTEIPFSRRGEDGRAENGLIDALIQRDGRWTIVEFKTDHIHNDAHAQQTVMEEGYLGQAGRYMRAVEDLVGAKPRHMVCWLDYAGKVVCDALLDH